MVKESKMSIDYMLKLKCESVWWQQTYIQTYGYQKWQTPIVFKSNGEEKLNVMWSYVQSKL